MDSLRVWCFRLRFTAGLRQICLGCRRVDQGFDIRELIQSLLDQRAYDFPPEPTKPAPQWGDGHRSDTTLPDLLDECVQPGPDIFETGR